MTCNNGTRYRKRGCTNPVPQHRGKNCTSLGADIEYVPCYLKPCPIDGDYSNWTEFSSCSRTCGNGTRTRSRNCTNPMPQHGGKNCSALGHSTQVEFCFTHSCPVHANYTQWSEFTQCSRTCGNGTKTRTRNCTNPLPQHGGNNCSMYGHHTHSISCNSHPCPIHGNYSQWTKFSTCSSSCGNGTKTRTRNCTNPLPQHGGKNCSIYGHHTQVFPCNTHPCPIHGNYTQWGTFSHCSQSCGNGTKHRTRNCSNPIPQHGGSNCSVHGRHTQTASCNTHPCPIHGNYTKWSKFSQCSLSCGNGTKYRTRNCSNPTPQHGGSNCSVHGHHTQNASCNTHPCPVHGNYTIWSEFSQCSLSCGNGTKTRRRYCSNPTPQHGGSNCSIHGHHTQTVYCNAHPCPIHGNYTKWSEFSKCSLSCGNGTKTRTRNCSNPIPQHGGGNCSYHGHHIQTIYCNIHPCPVHGNYTHWSKFSQCSLSCGNGTKTRTRNCSNPTPQHGGSNCSIHGHHIQTIYCNTHPCPVHGNYTHWSKFSQCSLSCGNGTKTRTRNCSNPTPQHGGSNCSIHGDHIQTISCKTQPCPVHGNYTHWSKFSQCSLSCGIGTKTRTRNCSNPTPQHGGSNCSIHGHHTQTASCNTHPCPVHGNYTHWSKFSQCSLSCGNGTKTRTRNCSNPTPQHGGSNCSVHGHHTQTVSCNTHPCPVHGNYSEWTGFSPCSQSCGNGTKTRTRSCTNPSPQYGGNNCSHYGNSSHVLACNTHHCPVDGGYTAWSSFSRCTESCGNGTKRRSRRCTNPLPQFGGRNCSASGPSFETKVCFMRPCPVHGGYTPWSKFSPCSKECAGGTQQRTRNCSNPIPKHGGKSCINLGQATEMRVCNLHNCPVDGGYSNWTEFTNCTKTCGNGTKTRSRSCSNPLPQYGGRNCSKLGPDIETVECNTHHCPIDGNYTTWTSWTACSSTCGNGERQRSRRCAKPPPQFGGKNCSRFGRAIQVIDCYLVPCPINGGYSSWTSFTVCTKLCNNGTRQRTRMCNSPPPQYGGRNCSGPDEEVELCNQHPCPIDGGFTEWLDYGQCSRTCGGGERIRERSCTKPRPQHGGRNCSVIGPYREAIPCNNTRPCPGL